MRDCTYIPDWSEFDGCPVHDDSPIRRIYTFGINDAEVATFRNCGCAVCTNVSSAVCGGRDTDVTYHTDYQAAAGRAKLIVHHWVLQ